jgi:signal transduction histidine kinase/CheY-like chemotaxis protein
MATKIAFYIYAFINIIYYFIMIKQTKNPRKNKKLRPLYSVLLITIVMMIIQLSFDYAIIITAAETFVCIMIYLSMENPDLIMLDKIEKIKTISQKVNEEKTIFLSNMSHEIRTPLNVIIGLSDEIKKKDLKPDELEKINDIIISSNNLLELVNGILDISKIETGKLEIFESNYSFEKIFNELVTLTKIRLDEKKLKLKTHYDSNIPTILKGDKLRVKQVILNLLTNAVKYSEKGTIEFNVTSRIKDKTCILEISVKDQGKGFNEEDIPRLFNKFERLSEEGGKIEGTGLGLPISKKVIELMKGRIEVESELNKGSTFTIILPQKIVELDQNFIETKKYDDNIKFSHKKILVVDDNDLNLKVAKRKLDSYGIEADIAFSAIECLNKLETEKYDLILMDDMMSEMTGTEAMKKIKEEEITKTPIVVLTANAIAGMREKYMSEGFDEYLSKPINNDELKRVLIHFLK